ncbi:MAG: radical domain iron-sulfur cluster-binding oxidoreductase with cobalamin-binding-like domain [Acidobacteria bacterium]|nr:radical domain iron-sulfur cluster-binding oxidoreductase with cobalamin-binding-like domain [Acidobacteriota bacterium]
MSRTLAVLFVSANTERLNMATMPLGLGLVCAATRRAGHDAAFLDLLVEPDPSTAVSRAIAAFAPDVIGISIRNIDDQCRDHPRFLLGPARTLVQECRGLTCSPVVVGGAGYSIFPRAALSFLGADYGVAGDGEEVFPALLESLASGAAVPDLPGLYTPERVPSLPRADCGALDGQPAWDEALGASIAPEVWVPIQGRRGCPNDCSYCSTSSIQGRTIRRRPPAEVAALVGRLGATGAARFYFVDNSFNIPERHALELCAALSALRPRPAWRCILYPERVSEELVAAMAGAGCVEASLGFESGCKRILREMNKRFTPADVRRTSGLLARHGIRRMGFLLLGGPGETRESVEESLAFAHSLALDDLRVTVGIRIYPGTPLAGKARAEGVVAPGDDLLQPRFYLAPGLDGWIQERVAAAAREDPVA